MIVAGFLSLMCAGPGTLILVAVAPSSVTLLGRIICPAGTNMDARWVRYSYNRPGESNLEVACVDGSGKPPGESRTWWFLKLSSFYFVLFLLPLLLISLTTGADESPRARQTHLTPEAELEVKRLLAQGKKLEAIKLMRELAGIGLREAEDYVETLPAALVTDQPVETREEPAERLQQLKEMLDAELITEQEYEAKKAAILSKL